MMNRLLVILSMFLLMAFGLPAAMAAPAVKAAGDDVHVSLAVFKVVQQADGKESLVAGDAGPGDIVEYQVRYTNAGSTGVKNLLATLPIPVGGLEYLPAGASPANVQASLDGVTFAPVPLKRNVTGADGKAVVQLVPESQYRVLRWEIGELSPGKVATVRSRMRLSKFSNPLATTNEVK